MNNSSAAQLYDYDESINIHMHLILNNGIVVICLVDWFRNIANFLID